MQKARTCIHTNRHTRVYIQTGTHGHVDSKGLAALDMALGSVEMGIARDDLSGFYEI